MNTNDARTDIVMPHYYCSICKCDLNRAVAILGEDAWNFHMMLHQKHEIERLRAGIESIRDGGYGCQQECEDILAGDHSFLESI